MTNAKQPLEEREAEAVKRGTDPQRIYHTNPEGTRVFHWELTCLTCGKRHESRSIEAVRCAECGIKNLEEQKK